MTAALSKNRLALPLGALALVFSMAVVAMADEQPPYPLCPSTPTPTPEILNSERGFRDREWSFLGHGLATYYGNEEDGFLGRRHYASWSDETPAGFSEMVVACCQPGVALSNTWGVDIGQEVLIVRDEEHLAVSAIRVDALPSMHVDLYEWLYRELSPQDLGPLEISLYSRRSIWEMGGRRRLLLEEDNHDPTNTARTNCTPAEF